MFSSFSEVTGGGERNQKCSPVRVAFLQNNNLWWSCHELVFDVKVDPVSADEKVVKPVVSVYPAASRAHLEGKSSLLCLASDMFPPLVQISWKRQKKDGDLENLPPVEGEQLELRESGRTASILLVDRNPFYTKRYHCSVNHEGGRVEAQRLQEVHPWILVAPFRVKLLCLLYTVLIVKSLVYCCGLSLLMMLRTKGPSTI
ncbi:uncharacterized protein LOC124869738 [Girardinichthys multiradiatus]|uniref:uncharacterized protein LOC124869738 n=1 Tax=Girardinichthys multiradiatus TaxID=208333 RepID=UPI001FAC50BE|nr:uncharacterized protein LOC124869738 [Girardinichthys multiradiatus]